MMAPMRMERIAVDPERMGGVPPLPSPSFFGASPSSHPTSTRRFWAPNLPALIEDLDPGVVSLSPARLAMRNLPIR